MATTSTDLASLARELQKPEAEIMTMAFEAGLRQLWRERILGTLMETRSSSISTSESETEPLEVDDGPWSIPADRWKPQ